ncbi:hypothetical protein FH972_024859 [Carpinus fangiana]|uniref:BAR domain-containing protein n=1 Tax=Carpinus fangiana TaxID=176857 RepID=A0A5N6L090_9ROSI|nr:hypothetical protein FH972_024859 [Carpinus fangiana]
MNVNMNVNKKLDRFCQWSKEKVSKDSPKTTADDEFKSLEQEMNVRHEGMQKLHTSTNAYVKSLNKRTEGDSRDKQIPISYLGQTMSKHGQEFEDDSKFGACLSGLGQANERIGRMQETYAVSATGGWLESTERSLVQMKEYQNARKKLESRRLAYDTTLTKMHKAKKEDYRLEEELRGQKVKYEESTEDVTRRMQDIIDAEAESVNELYSFLEAEITYYDRCRDILLQLKSNWPAPVNDGILPPPSHRRPPAPRSRTNTLSRMPTTSTIEEDDALEAPTIPWRGSRANSAASSPRHEHPGFDFSSSPSRGNNLMRTPTSESVNSQRVQLRPVQRRNDNFFGDGDDNRSNSSAEGYSGERSASPATTTSQISRNTSWSTFDGQAAQQKMKKAPPPPPPSRSTKPPPPPPMKRSALSTSSVPQM